MIQVNKLLIASQILCAMSTHTLSFLCSGHVCRILVNILQFVLLVVCQTRVWIRQEKSIRKFLSWKFDVWRKALRFHTGWMQLQYQIQYQYRHFLYICTGNLPYLCTASIWWCVFWWRVFPFFYCMFWWRMYSEIYSGTVKCKMSICTTLNLT
jgi:hypothetical protein